MRERAVGLVVYQEVGRRQAAFGKRDHFQLELPRLQAQAPVLSGAEDQRLAVLDVQLRPRRAVLRGETVERTVIEDHAVLEHLDERSAAVRVGALQYADQMPLQRVDRARDEARSGPARERARR